MQNIIEYGKKNCFEKQNQNQKKEEETESQQIIKLFKNFLPNRKKH